MKVSKSAIREALNGLSMSDQNKIRSAVSGLTIPGTTYIPEKSHAAARGLACKLLPHVPAQNGARGLAAWAGLTWGLSDTPPTTVSTVEYSVDVSSLTTEPPVKGKGKGKA